MSEKKMKKCGECGKEIKGEGKTVWKEGKLIMRYCEKCYNKPEVNERIRKMAAKNSHY
jgi:ribosome-binding protein aMBF1 (putative translation factor)